MHYLFQFTPLREGRLHSTTGGVQLDNFNSRPSARGDNFWRTLSANHSYFNSRPSARGDLFPTRAQQRTAFQFTPLREGRRLFWKFSMIADAISIHAPPRGATDDGTRVLKSYLFQFTPLREGRREIACIDLYKGNISIHAPPRGATHCGIDCPVLPFISIHAPPRGATSCPWS